MNISRFTFVVIACLSCISLSAKETNVLVLSSTKPLAEVKGVKPLNKTALISLVKKEVARNLRRAGKINIEFEDVYRQKTLDTAIGGNGGIRPYTYKCHSLAQWYFWPEGRKERLANLEGKGKTEQMPGVYAEGVKLVADKVREGSAKPVILLPWKLSKSNGTYPLAEVICRVGKSSGIPVLPKTSASRVEKLCSGTYDKENVFSMKYVDKRNVTYNHTGTSSERGIEGGLRGAAKRCRIDMRKTKPSPEKKIDFNYGRANTIFEKNKQYKVDPKLFDRSYGFPMQDHSKTAEETMLYGIDQRGNDDGTDLGIAWDMIRQKEVPKDIRCIPIRLMWAKLHDASPEIKPLRDRWHMSKYLDTATGNYIYTLLSGRCPIGEKPADADKNAMNDWYGQRIGYETAWRMAHLNDRVPGFAVRPKDKNPDLKSGAITNMEVKFYYPPASDVTVSISLDKEGAGKVEPKTLTFTPENYSTIQKVTVKGNNVDADTPFKVKLETKSEDNVFDKLQDSWSYMAKPSK